MAWASGRGVLGSRTFGVPAPVNTALPTNANGASIVTHYFRTRFTLPQAMTNIVLFTSNLLDDGAVFYVNGIEAARLRMPAGGRSTLLHARAVPREQDAFSNCCLSQPLTW
jgi:hypothetical protein